MEDKTLRLKVEKAIARLEHEAFMYKQDMCRWGGQDDKKSDWDWARQHYYVTEHCIIVLKSTLTEDCEA